MKKNILALFFLLLFACQNNSKENEDERNTYQIISLIINKLPKDIIKGSFIIPPPSLNYQHTIKDSLILYKEFFDYSYKPKIFAIENNMTIPTKNYYFHNSLNISKSIKEKWHSIKKEKK